MDFIIVGSDSLTHWKARTWLSWLSKKKFQTHPPKLAEVEPSFSLPPAKLLILFPAHLWVRDF